MADFKKAIPRILKHEGGYVNDPDDPGGETNFGIIDRLDGKTDGMIDVDGDSIPDVTVKELSVEQATVIYKRRFWDKMKGDSITSQPIAEIVFDGFVNCGFNGIKMLQRVLGVKDDGIIGPVTLKLLNTSTIDKDSERDIYKKYKEVRINYYKNLAERKPVLKKFLKGWLNRIESFKDL